MRILFLAAGIALIGAMSSPSVAADLVVPKQMPTKAAAPAKKLACLRWVPQTYSWYNYCDPIPYYGKHQNHWFGPF